MELKYHPRDIYLGLFWSKCRVTTMESDTENYRINVCIPFFQLSLVVPVKIHPKNRHKNW